MTTSSDRNLNLADAMILLAAFAIWFALIKVTLPLRNVPPKVVVVLNFLILVLDALVALTFAWLAMRLRQPRPRLRRLIRQPGFAACVVSAVCTLLVGSSRLGIAVFHLGWINPDILLLIALHSIGFAVGGSWLTLVLVGRWRPSPGWFDRAGRSIGGLWVVCLGTLWILGIAFSF